MKPRKHHQDTASVHGADPLDKRNAPLIPPICQTSTFESTSNEQMLHASHTDMFYTRYGNPTNSAVEAAIAELEGADMALLFSSGMAAITTSILSLVKAGDHIVAQRDIYGGVTKFLSDWLTKFGVETTFVDTNDYRQHESAIRPGTKLIYVESPANPTARIVDLKAIAALGRKHGILTMIDATFATPINQRPLDFGIDLVAHSGTKYYAGHADVICGIVAGRRELLEGILQTRTTTGAVMDPHAAFLLHRGMRTLAVRVQRQNENAVRVAEFLAGEPAIRRVHYPFLKENSQYALASEQMRGGGGVLSFEVEGTGEDALRVSEALRLFKLAPSLGGVEALVSIPVLTSHAMISPEHRAKMGVTEQMIRLSVGIENAEDLIADLAYALKVIHPVREQVHAG
jgi:cystathionine beta-lyase/cystathionine gamma-synthase